MKAKPAYIALEGPDGVGKSTTANALSAYLSAARPDVNVVIRHFPTRSLVDCAQKDNHRLMAEDYLCDMENWLSFRPSPVLYPSVPAPTPVRDATTVYILDRWVLSTAVYAYIRNETIPPRFDPTLEWLSQIPITTFVLMPKGDQATLLSDPDYPDPAGYDPVKVTDVYRQFMRGVLLQGLLDVYAPIAVDRTVDTPQKTAFAIAQWLGADSDETTTQEKVGQGDD